MAVVTANRVGEPVPLTCDDAQEQLDASVSVYLDGGARPAGPASTVVDLTEREPRLLRPGAVSVDQLRTVAPGLLLPEDEPDTEGGGGAEPVHPAS